MTQDFVGRLVRLLTSPAAEWDVIEREPADMVAIYRNYVGPLVVLWAGAALVGSLLFGVGAFGRPPFLVLVGNAVVKIVLVLAMVYVFALIVDALAPSFGAEKDFGQAFKVAAYAPTAGWVGGLFMLVPELGILSLLAALYTLYLLFIGLPKLMKPAAEKATNYAVAGILCLVGLAIVIRYIVGEQAYM